MKLFARGIRAGVALIALTALNSCGGDRNRNGSDEIAEGAFSMEPGEWETTMRITNVELEGFPQEMQDGIRQMQREARTQRGCIPFSFSVELVRYENMRFGFPPNGNCTIGEVSVGGGDVRGTMSCELNNLPGRNTPSNINISAEANGEYEDDRITMTAAANVTVPGEEQRGSAEVEITSRRVGDCPRGGGMGSGMSPMPMPVPVPTPRPPMSSNSMGPSTGSMGNGM